MISEGFGDASAFSDRFSTPNDPSATLSSDIFRLLLTLYLICFCLAGLATLSHHLQAFRMSLAVKTKQISLKSQILAGTKEIMLDSSWWWHWDRFYSSEESVISGKQALLRNGKNDSKFCHLRKQRNFDFLNRQRQASNSIRFIRNRGHQGNQHQRGFNNSTAQSPFEGFVQPNHIRSDVLLRASLFTVAVSAQNIIEIRLMTFNP